VDDEQHAIEIISRFIQKTPSLSLRYSTTNPLEGLQFLMSHSVDLIFLDVNMPELSGMEFIKIIGEKSKIILTTAYSEYALEGYECNVVDYLLKPIAFERFLKATQKVQQLLPQGNKEAKEVEAVEDFLLLKTETKGKMVKVNIKDIHYIQGEKNYVSIFTNNDRIVTLLSIKELEERLPPFRFLRVHKSYIVSIDKIMLIEGNQLVLQPTSRHVYVPLGGTYKESFFNLMENRMIGKKPGMPESGTPDN
jgi:DNA-binding LytR/AlgR family response regulator